jgi:hypothetical protein
MNTLLLLSVTVLKRVIGEKKIIAVAPHNGVVTITHGNQVTFLPGRRCRGCCGDRISETCLRTCIDFIRTVARDDDVGAVVPIDDGRGVIGIDCILAGSTV